MPAASERPGHFEERPVDGDHVRRRRVRPSHHRPGPFIAGREDVRTFRTPPPPPRGSPRRRPRWQELDRSREKQQRRRSRKLRGDARRRGGPRVVHPDRRRRSRHGSRRRVPPRRRRPPARCHGRPNAPARGDAMEARRVRPEHAPFTRDLARVALLLDRQGGAARVREAGAIPDLFPVATRREAERGGSVGRGVDRRVRRARDGAPFPFSVGRRSSTASRCRFVPTPRRWSSLPRAARARGRREATRTRGTERGVRTHPGGR